MVIGRAGYPQDQCISRAVLSCESDVGTNFRPRKGAVK